MSIALQAIAALHARTNQPVTKTAKVTAGSVRQVERLAQPVEIYPTEFQHGPRNARIEILASGEHSVLCYDASTDYNELLIRQSKQAAIESAQAWVKRAF